MRKIIILILSLLIILLVGCKQNSNVLAISLLEKHLASEDMELVVPYDDNGETKYIKINKYEIVQCYIEVIGNSLTVNKQSKKIQIEDNDVAYLKSSHDGSNLDMYFQKDGKLIIILDNVYYKSEKKAFKYEKIFEVVDIKDIGFSESFNETNRFSINYHSIEKPSDKYSSKSSLRQWLYWEKATSTIEDFSIKLLKLPYVSFIEGKSRVMIYNYFNNKYIQNSSSYLQLTTKFAFTSSEEDVLINSYFDELYYSGYSSKDKIKEFCSILINIAQNNDQEIEIETNRLWDEYCLENSIE